MDIDKVLQETKEKSNEALKRLNLLEHDKQNLLQEILRLDGEVRVLKRISEEYVDKEPQEETKE